MLSSSSQFCDFVFFFSPLVGGLLAAGGLGGIARYASHLRALPAAERLRRAVFCLAVLAGPWFAACAILDLAGVPAGSQIESVALTVAGVATALGVFWLAVAGELLIPRRGIAMASAVAMLALVAVLRIVPLSMAAAVSIGWRAMRQLSVVLPPPRRRLVDVNLTTRLLPIPRPAWG